MKAYSYLNYKSKAFHKPPWLAELVKAPSMFYGNLPWFEPTQGIKIIADVRNQQPFEPGSEMLTLSGHLCASFIRPACKKEQGSIKSQGLTRDMQKRFHIVKGSLLT